MNLFFRQTRRLNQIGISVSMLSIVVVLTAAAVLSSASPVSRLQESGSEQENEQENEQAEPTATFDEDQIEFFKSRIRPILEANCFECHGDNPEKLGGELALLSRRLILEGGDSGAAVDLADPSDSLLLDAINYGDYEMPPSGQLAEEDIAVLTEWVEMGLPWTAHDAERTLEAVEAGIVPPEVNEETRNFWSFQPVTKPDVPEVEHSDWIANEIDNFVLTRLEQAGLTPAPPASRQQLVRRVYYDLTGLPPSPDEVEEFLADESPDAYEQLIERLLASPHYGEKWGRHWLDVVRYAESNSFERDGTKPFVWRYRDYVIAAFNEDKPYDTFLTEQLAGDEIENPTNESIIATGYYRLGQWDDEPADPKQALYDDLDDILATTSQGMIGLTINCARCHDHKIDPIPAKDYYSMLAFFRNVRRFGVRGHDTVLDASSRQVEMEEPPEQESIDEFEKQIAERQTVIDEIEAIVKPDFEPVEVEDYQYVENRIRLVEARVNSELISQEQFNRYRDATHQLNDLRENPPHLYRVLCVKENEDDPPQTHVLIRGNPELEGDPVEPGFVSVLSPPAPEIARPENSQSSGRRLALAKWITSETHPLTARVMVNRIWQHHFGRGIVGTSNDFGFQGDRPTHPELLDWLASEFVKQNWSIKQMHRMIMMSNTYRMSCEFNPDADAVDPLNHLLWRFNMRRLTAEEVRDSILAVSDRLERERMFGPSIFEKLSQEVLDGQSMPGQGWGDSLPEDRARRSIYIHVKRSLSVPLLANFDSADTDFSCPVRFNTTQPTQALGLINSEFTNTESEMFAQLVAAKFKKPEDQVREILSRVTQRTPTDAEIANGVGLIDDWQTEDGVSAEQALAFYCLFAINLNEFIFLD